MSHAAARPACAAGPADRVPVPLKRWSAHALLCCNRMLISQCIMIALHQEGCTACLSGHYQSFSACLWRCDDCSVWQDLPLSLIQCCPRLCCNADVQDLCMYRQQASIECITSHGLRVSPGKRRRKSLSIHARPAALVDWAFACVLTHALSGALLPTQFGAFFQSSMAAAARGLLAAATPPGASSPGRGCSSWWADAAIF